MKSFKKILFILYLICLSNISFSQVLDDFRSNANGNWNAIATWQRYNGTTWVAAVAFPTSANGTITISTGNTVTITATVTLDQVIIDLGATLTSSGASPTVFTNGAGVELTINGTFLDNYAAATNIITWNAGASWQFGTTGTLIKTTASSSNNWQNRYEGGASTMPATANWIIRRNTVVNIPLSSTAPATGSVYPNLTIENNVAGVWTPIVGSGFTGSAAFPTVKGNFDLGGIGASTIAFPSANTNATTGLRIQGNMNVRTGNTFNNNGTGFQLAGNLTVNGTIAYDANDGRNIEFNGGNNSTVSGTGSLNVFYLRMSKTGNTSVTLNRAILIDNSGVYTSGYLVSTAVNLLTYAATATVSGASDASHSVGPVRYNGSAAFTFPIGKSYGVSSYYRPIGINATASGAGAAFFTENFNTIGAWTNSVLGAEGADPNFFIVDDNESGMAVGACGAAGMGNPTLHVTSIFNPSGGAAYDAGGLCGFLFCPQANRRLESPTINCTGQVGIQAQFKYIENGQALLDNAQFWYFDGATWTILDDMPKTLTGCGGQGIWTARTVVLPVSANNNPNVRLGFSWINNDDGAGTDPSFAVDDVTLSVSGPAADPFQAEYFVANPQTTFNNILEPGLDHISACEYWILDRIGSTTSKTVTASWNNVMWPANQCDVTVPSELLVARWDGAMWRNHGNGATTGSVASGTINTAAPVTNFSPFTLSSSTVSNPLPIEMGDFSAKCVEDIVILKWQTLSERNNAFFSIEGSDDMQNWEQVTSKEGIGNSSNLVNYTTFTSKKKAFYRIVQFDTDGNKKQFDPIQLNCDSNEAFQLYPNPIEDLVNIRSDKSLSSIKIFDLQGKLIFTKDFTNENSFFTQINTDFLISGIYFFEVSTLFKTEKIKVIVQ